MQIKFNKTFAKIKKLLKLKMPILGENKYYSSNKLNSQN